MFKKHLKEAGKSYWEHFKFAFIAGFILIYAGITSIIHAIFPCFFQFTSLKIVKYLLKQAE
tara:strand:+ start:1010 stop:1192 length:183 start_codon:yes stop_codon:yes gene_type:complete